MNKEKKEAEAISISVGDVIKCFEGIQALKEKKGPDGTLVYKRIDLPTRAAYWTGRLEELLIPIVKNSNTTQLSLGEKFGETMKTPEGDVIKGQFAIYPAKQQAYKEELEKMHDQIETVSFKKMDYEIFEDLDANGNNTLRIPQIFMSSVGRYFINEPK